VERVLFHAYVFLRAVHYEQGPMIVKQRFAPDKCAVLTEMLWMFCPMTLGYTTCAFPPLVFTSDIVPLCRLPAQGIVAMKKG
jgi:hypothetical protein